VGESSKFNLKTPEYHLENMYKYGCVKSYEPCVAHIGKRAKEEKP
jgi:hypothetical protein